MALLETPQAVRRFLIGFVGLTLLSGVTIGMNKVLATLLGIQLQVSNLQLATISSAETFAMAIGTLPAGYILSRGNPKVLYATVSLLLSAIFCVLPWLPDWQWVAIIMFLVGLCISLRVVATSTVFLVRLPEIGQSKAGWYKGTLTLGIQFLGPLIGNTAIAQMGLQAGFWVSSALFAVLAVLGWSVLPDTTGNPRTVAVGTASSLRSLLALPVVRVSYVFEALASFTASSVGVFSIVLALRVLHWPREHAVWLMAVQGLSYVAVLFGLGKIVLRSVWRDRYYAGAHIVVLLALLTLAWMPWSLAYVLASVGLGCGLGVNNLVNMDRISRAPADKAKISAHLTLLGMAGGSLGALSVGHLSDRMGLQPVFLLLTIPWLLAWAFYHAPLFWTRRSGANSAAGVTVAPTASVVPHAAPQGD